VLGEIARLDFPDEDMLDAVTLAIVEQKSRYSKVIISCFCRFIRPALLFACFKSSCCILT
jgi:hypothetical protein